MWAETAPNPRQPRKNPLDWHRAKGPVAVAETKRLAQATASLSLDDGLRAEVEAFGRIFATGDSAEGIAAFLEKRPPNFSGS